MAETTEITFSHQETVAALLKSQDIHEGSRRLTVRFGLAAANAGPTDDELNPAAVIPVLNIGLRRRDKLTGLAVDAAEVNPKSETGGPTEQGHTRASGRKKTIRRGEP